MILCLIDLSERNQGIWIPWLLYDNINNTINNINLIYYLDILYNRSLYHDSTCYEYSKVWSIGPLGMLNLVCWFEIIWQLPNNPKAIKLIYSFA